MSKEIHMKKITKKGVACKSSVDDRQHAQDHNDSHDIFHNKKLPSSKSAHIFMKVILMNDMTRPINYKYKTKD